MSLDKKLEVQGLCGQIHERVGTGNFLHVFDAANFQIIVLGGSFAAAEKAFQKAWQQWRIDRNEDALAIAIEVYGKEMLKRPASGD